MWINGTISIDNRKQTAVRDVIDGIPAVPLHKFGIDNDSPLPVKQLYTVGVPETACPLTEAGKQDFLDILEFTANVEDAIEQYSVAQRHFNQLLTPELSEDSD